MSPSRRKPPEASTRKEPKSPTKTALKRQERAAKSANKNAWNTYIATHQWTRDPAYQQALWSLQVHRSDAMKYFRLKGVEMDTLPYVEFANDHHEHAPPGRAYALESVKQLVYRKFATLAGVPSQPEDVFFARGKALFDADMASRSGTRKLKFYKMVPRRPPSPEISEAWSLKFDSLWNTAMGGELGE